MKIIIIGAGFTGAQLARKLIDEKNDVILIDNDEETVRHAANQLDCSVICADGNNLETLESAGIGSADALITLTDSDEYNMITCSLVDAIYPELLKIARVRDYAYYFNRENARLRSEALAEHRALYGIDFMIHPDVEAAEKIVRAVEHGAVSDVLAFDGGYELTAVMIEQGSPFDGVALRDVHRLADCPFVIACIEKASGVMLPSGETILSAGDRISILAHETHIGELLKLANARIESLRKIAIFGAERIGMMVAERIIKHRQSTFLRRIFGRSPEKLAKNLILIDEDEDRCKEASERFRDVKVLCGDMTDDRLIREEGLEQSDLVVATTHNYERNVIVAAFMESIGVKHSVALAANSAFANVARRIGVDVAVPMRDAVVDSIMSHLRGKNVSAIHTIADGSFEIVECDVAEGCAYAGKTLCKIAQPGEYLLLLVREPGKKRYQLPVGNTVLVEGSHLVMIARTGDKKTLRRFGK